MKKLLTIFAALFSILSMAACTPEPETPGGNNGGGGETPDTTPEITLTAGELTANSFSFVVTTNVAGELGYAVVAEGSKNPSIDEIFARNIANVADSATLTVGDLNDNTNYTLFAVLRATQGGILSSPKKLTFTTPDDGEESPIVINEVGYDSANFTINLPGEIMFQCIDKSSLETYNKTIEEYIQTEGIAIVDEGPITVDWINGAYYGPIEMRMRDNSEYYVIAARSDGARPAPNTVGEIYYKSFKTLSKPVSEAGITTQLTNITSTSVNIKTTPDSTVTQYYVYVRDKMWAAGSINGYGESMLSTLVKSPNSGSWNLYSENEATWGGLTPATDYYCMIAVVDNKGAESLTKVEFRTENSTGIAPSVDISLTQHVGKAHNTLSLNIYSADAAAVKIAFNTKADISYLRNQDIDDETIITSNGIDLSPEQVEAIRTTGLSIKMEDLYPDVEYIALVNVMNAEKTPTIKAATAATAPRPIPARVESDLFETLKGEWEVSYNLIQFNQQNVYISGEKVTIAQGVDDTSKQMYREQNRLVILDWPFNVYGAGNYEHIPTMLPSDLAEAMPDYWGKNPQLAYRDYGPKIFLEIAADGTVTVPSERGEYFYNWSSDGTFYFYGADIENSFTAPATFPVTISADGNTLTIGASTPVEEFGYGVYRPAVFRDNSPWALATSDIVLTRVK
jgi:hypothetical protein